MPRKTRKAVNTVLVRKKHDSNENPQNDSVAKVNTRGRTRSAETAATNNKRRSSSINENANQNSTKRKRRSVPITKETNNTAENLNSSQESEILSERDDGKTAEISFREGDQIIQMSVQRNEDCFRDEETESSDDEDIVFNDKNNSESTQSEAELPIPSTSTADTIPEQGVEKDKRRSSVVKAKERIKNLNKEMREKIRELQNLMTEGDMNESLEVLDELLPREQPQRAVENEQQVEIPQQRRNKKQRKDTSNDEGINANHNSLAKPNSSRSEETIYVNAVQQKRFSSSSEEDELPISDVGLIPRNDINVVSYPVQNDDYSQRFNNLKVSVEGEVRKANNIRNEEMDWVDEQERMSAKGDGDTQERGQRSQMMSPEEKARKMVQEAETAKARMFATTGRDTTAHFDENYIVVGAHVDEATVTKIQNGDYVDFGKLIPRDRVLREDDGRMEMVVKNGRTFWVPYAETTVISSFNKWEQAFRVFANLYTKAHPHRSAELIEYNHIIHTISLTYLWENVYMYDKDFRLHLARFPDRRWGLILQQAWFLRLKDRIGTVRSDGFSGGSGNFNNNRGKVNEPCRRFNRGKCNYGAACKYEHRCNYCFKFGHANVNCRKAIADRGHASNHRNGTNSGGTATVTTPNREMPDGAIDKNMGNNNNNNYKK